MDTLDTLEEFEQYRGGFCTLECSSHTRCLKRSRPVCELKLRAEPVSEGFFFPPLMEGEPQLGGERSGKRWNTKHASKARAPEGRGGTELHLKKFWHCTSIISTAALSPLFFFSSSSPPIPPSLNSWLQSAIYAKTGVFLSLLSLLPGGTLCFLEHSYQFLLLRKEKWEIKTSFFVLSLQCLSSGTCWFSLFCPFVLGGSFVTL